MVAYQELFSIQRPKQEVPAASTEVRPSNRYSPEMFRGGIVFKAPRLLYHSTLVVKAIKKTNRYSPEEGTT